MLKSINIFNTLDSTNLHAMRRISEGLSVHGELVMTYHQTNGKGQREKVWSDTSHDSLLMSLILHENLDRLSIIELNMIVSLSVVEVLNTYINPLSSVIKWPNDILVNNKKICGILIENGFKGSSWSHSVIGIGININQESFNEELNRAISVYQLSETKYEVTEIGIKIGECILRNIQSFDIQDKSEFRRLYKNTLFKINEKIEIKELPHGPIHDYVFKDIDTWGRAVFLDDSNEEHIYAHGSIEWLY